MSTGLAAARTGLAGRVDRTAAAVVGTVRAVDRRGPAGRDRAAEVAVRVSVRLLRRILSGLLLPVRIGLILSVGRLLPIVAHE